MMRRIERTILVLAVTLTTAWTMPAFAGKYVGKEFPDFTATDAISGKRFKLSDLRGQVVLVDFWATWCPPCMAEMPNVKSTYRKYRNQGFEIVSISLDQNQAKFKRVARASMPWYHVMDGRGWDAALARKYGVRGIPAMFIIDHEGVCISDKARGDALGRIVERAIAKLPDAPESTSTERERPRQRVTAARWTQLADQVEAAQTSLSAARAPVRAQRQGLDEVLRVVDQLATELPVPRSPDRWVRRYKTLRDDLGGIRHELFVCGHLDETLFKLPQDHFAGDGDVARDDLLRAGAELTEVRKTIEAMKTGFDKIDNQIGALASKLESTRKSVARQAGGFDRLATECEQLHASAVDLEERCHRPWQRQLAMVDTVLGKMNGGAAGDDSPFDDLRQRIAACRELMPRISSSAGTAVKVRQEFTEICAQVTSIATELERTGAVDSSDLILPTNPFERGAPRDIRTRIEAGKQLDQADATLAQMQEHMADTGAAIGLFAERVERMQTELASADGDPARLTDLEQQFRTLCSEILVARDGS